MDLTGDNPMLLTTRSSVPDRATIGAGALVAVLVAATAGAVAIVAGHVANRPLRLVTRTHGPRTAVLAGSPGVVAAKTAHALFAGAPLVVLATSGHRSAIAEAAAQARKVHAPLLLVPPASASRAGVAAGRGRRAYDLTATRARNQAASAAIALRGEVRALGARQVLAVGVASSLLSTRLPGVQVITDPHQVAAIQPPVKLKHVVVLVRRGDVSQGTRAALATARAAGAQLIPLSGDDPRTDPAAIKALSAARPARVLAIGAGFGTARELAARVAVAETGVQLPGGGQVLFPMHRLLALYGYPGSPQLGALGAQGLSASIARIRRIAAAYQPLSSVPVVPAFEIIATVAQASPGTSGSYSYESRPATLLPWVRAATAAGMYVVLDLQPGRDSLLAQARQYTSLLRLPNVGLALDPEWKLQPGELPLHQIGSVSSTEINGVISWLANLTARDHLPQKLVVLHQFRLSMITDERALDTRHDDLAIVIHMDGQGTPTDKLQTWQAVTSTAPAGVFFGWKNFYTKDHPTFSPLQTMANTPQPVMISYQ
jgi:hypothetical protein